MVLEQGRNDFKSLIERLKVMKAFDDAARDGDRLEMLFYNIFYLFTQFCLRQ